MKKIKLLAILYLFGALGVMAQGNFILQKDKSDKINFKLINNLIIIPVEVNGVQLSFLLDTGVSKPIIFNFLNITEALQINQAEQIFLRGLGEGEPVEALKSSGNIFKIGKAININQDLYAIFDPALNFAPRLGVPIHGIIGYDLLKNFIVEINYSKRFIRINNHATYQPKRCRGCVTLKLDFFNNKPYVNSVVNLNNVEIPVKLLIDSGGSDALWLFQDESKNVLVPKKYFDDFLGRGLSGKVYGKRAKVSGFTLAEFELKNVNVAFPDSTSISYARKFKDRNGSIAGNILKRFNLIFNYAEGTVSIKRNRHFSDPFYYNKSGIELEHDGVRVVKEVNRNIPLNPMGTGNESVAQQSLIVAGSYRYALAPSFVIVEIRKGSPAEKAGLEVGDVILNINNKHAHDYEMHQIIQMLYGDAGKRIKLIVDRRGVQRKFQFKLEDLL